MSTINNEPGMINQPVAPIQFNISCSAGSNEKVDHVNGCDDEHSKQTQRFSENIFKNNDPHKELTWEYMKPITNDDEQLQRPKFGSVPRTSLLHSSEEEEYAGDDGDDDGDSDSHITFASLSQSGRSISMTERLQQQGFVERQVNRTSRSSNFAMKSIRRGSTEWNQTLRPFVANIVFESFVQRRYYQNEGSSSIQRFRPYNCYAAVLFVDLCNYSKITASIAHRGAHVLSNVVNEYLHRILLIVKQYGGDVITFAGDAIIVVWYSTLDNDLQLNVLTAAKCVLDMQQKAGNHPVDGTSLFFRIHCGLSCGLLESEIFAAHSHMNMQRLFHTVGGNSLVEQSDLVDMAKPGEVCISDNVAEYLGTNGRCMERLDESGVPFKILTEIHFDKNMTKAIKLNIAKNKNRQEQKRIKSFEEEFIHPNVVKLLSHGGLSPTQISQMRNLCVLFIAMTSNFGSTVNWLMEVQTILDKHRCPIVQLLEDDKGVHLVAAVNLAESIPECSLVGLEICRELIAKEVGCVIGMASGPTFCGVIGSSDVACRWDIAGPPPVRAARLMQYALNSDTCNVAIDQSVYDDPMAFTRLKLLNSNVNIKGTKDGISVYTLSNCESSVAFRVLETVHGRIHDDLVDEISMYINRGHARVAVVVTGIPLSGKKIICQRAAGCADLVPYLHLSDESAGFLQLAKTISTWFQYVDDDDVRQSAKNVHELLTKQHWSRSHDECINLVDMALAKGLRACFLIDRIQFLDDFSLSLLRECLSDRENNRRRSRRSSERRVSVSRSKSFRLSELTVKKVCFLCVHVSFYSGKSALDVVSDISRSHDELQIPVVRVGEAKREELRTMFRDLSDMEVEDRWLDAYSDASGNCAGYFIERVAAIRTKSSKLWSEGKRPYAETTEKLVLHLPFGLVRRNKTLPVMEVSAEIAMRFHQIFDELPPLCQTTLKVLTVSSRSGFVYHLPQKVLWEVLNDLIADGVEWNIFTSLVSELALLDILKIETKNGEDVLSFQCPAFADVAYDVSTPIQIQSIAGALAERLHLRFNDSFVVPLVLAGLCHLLGRSCSSLKDFWVKGYNMFLNECSGCSDAHKNKWKECIDDEISSMGCSTCEILGGTFCLDKSEPRTVGKILPLLKIYSAPVAFGPMGHSLSVITRNTFHEYGIFHGAYSADDAKLLYDASLSASKRYLLQLDIVETYLKENGFPGNRELLEKERDFIRFVVKPAMDAKGVQEKAEKILNEYVPQFVQQRLQRLHSLISVLHLKDIPELVLRSDKAVLRAYKALRVDKDTTDATQDALVILATMNWKPKPVPEFLPLLHYQTVARLRNKVLKRLNDAELFMFKHQQTHIDLEAFLVVTALLSDVHT